MYDEWPKMKRDTWQKSSLFPFKKTGFLSSKDLFIKIRTITIVKLLLILYEFLWISLYLSSFSAVCRTYGLTNQQLLYRRTTIQFFLGVLLTKMCSCSRIYGKLEKRCICLRFYFVGKSAKYEDLYYVYLVITFYHATFALIFFRNTP